jgi:hypothetical protein
MAHVVHRMCGRLGETCAPVRASAHALTCACLCPPTDDAVVPPPLLPQEFASVTDARRMKEQVKRTRIRKERISKARAARALRGALCKREQAGVRSARAGARAAGGAGGA